MERSFEDYVFHLTEEEEIFAKEVHRFAEKSLKPISISVQHENAFLANTDSLLKKAFWQAVKVLRDAGHTALGIPEEYGGIPCPSKMQAISTEEICRVDGAIGLSVGATLALVVYPIVLFGSEKQKQRWLPEFAQGNILGCYCQTESEAGSDVKNIKTNAWQDSNGSWRIRGTKVFITNGSEANLALVIARTSPEPYKGLTAFLVNLSEEKRRGTVSVIRNELKGGLHLSPTTELSFDGAQGEVLGGIESLGRGWDIAMTTLVCSRATAIGAQGVGIARGAYELVSEYTKNRAVFGKKIADFPINAEQLAIMRTMVEMGRLLTFRSCFYKDALGPEKYKLWQQEASVAKRFAGDIAELVPSLAIQLAGGIGYMAEFGLVKRWQDGKVVSIYEGTNQIQELIIAESLGRRTAAHVPKNSLVRLLWARGFSWTASLDNEELLFGKAIHNTDKALMHLIRDFSQLRKLFTKALFAAGQKYRPTKEELEHNQLRLVWHKLAWALCVLEGTKMLLWKSSCVPEEYQCGEIRVAFYLCENALDEVYRILEHPEYEEAIRSFAIVPLQCFQGGEQK